MKKLHITAVVLLASFAILSYSISKANSTGSAGGYSSSKGDNNRSCGKNGCHGGGNTLKTGLITTDVPATGYEPGKEYTITVNVSSSGITRYGFELSAEGANGNQVGTFIDAGSSEYYVVKNAVNPSGNGHVTHTSTSIDASSGTKTWNVTWRAPQMSSETNTTFSVAIIAANKDWLSTGDNCLISSTTVNAHPSVSITNTQVQEDFKVYPNPTAGLLYIQSPQAPSKVEVMSLSGAVLRELVFSGNETCDISDLPNGHYVIRFTNEDVIKTTQIIKL